MYVLCGKIVATGGGGQALAQHLLDAAEAPGDVEAVIIAEMDMSTPIAMETLGGKGLPAADLRKG